MEDGHTFTIGVSTKNNGYGRCGGEDARMCVCVRVCVCVCVCVCVYVALFENRSFPPPMLQNKCKRVEIMTEKKGVLLFRVDGNHLLPCSPCTVRWQHGGERGLNLGGMQHARKDGWMSAC